MSEQRLKIGVIGTPGAWSSETLAHAVTDRTGERLLFDMKDVYADFEANRLFHQDTELTLLDALIIKKIDPVYSPSALDRLELLRLAVASGVSVFSDPERILRLLDRLSCTTTLRENNIPMPPTIVTESLQIAKGAVQRYDKAVLKPLFSTKARGMLVVQHGDADLADTLEAFQKENTMFYIQKKIDMPDRDLGVVFLGGEYVATYARMKDPDSWNTTTRSGGKYAAHTSDDSLIELAHRAQAPFGLDFTCVDIVETPDGPVVFEVSAFGGFRGLSEAHGIDAAALYADYVIGKTTATREQISGAA